MLFEKVILQTEPYTFLKDSSEKLVGNDRYEGFGVDLIEEMAKIEKFNYVIILRKDKSNGARNAHGQWSGMIGDLINKVKLCCLKIFDFNLIFSDCRFGDCRFDD